MTTKRINNNEPDWQNLRFSEDGAQCGRCQHAGRRSAATANCNHPDNPNPRWRMKREVCDAFDVRKPFKHWDELPLEGK